MDFIEDISNKNFKKSIKKSHELDETTIRELKRCLLIHHCIDNGDDTYSFTYSKYEDGEVLYFFTDLDEYHKCYPIEEENTLPLFWDFLFIKELLYKDTCGIIINPKNDNFFIPQDVLWDIIQDELLIKRHMDFNLKLYKDNRFGKSRIFTPEDLLNIEYKRNNDVLLKYMGNKKYFKYYRTLFSHFPFSVLYFLVQYDEPLDFKGDYYKPEHYITYKKDGYIMVFMDFDSLKNEIKDKNKFYYYGVADMVFLTGIVLEFDWEGIILKGSEHEFKLPRKHLLKHYDKLRMDWTDFELHNAQYYIFNINCSPIHEIH